MAPRNNRYLSTLKQTLPTVINSVILQNEHSVSMGIRTDTHHINATWYIYSSAVFEVNHYYGGA